jgi:hypothetical protein
MQVPQVKSLPLVQFVVRLPKQMSQYVVVYYDKKIRTTFNVTPPMLYRVAYGQRLQIILRVGVAALSLTQLTRSVKDLLKSSSLVL